LGLEINLFSFIPLINQSDKFYETEGIVKYFLPQALGSGILLLSSFVFLSNDFFVSILFFRLLIKAGAAPFHYWVAPVTCCLSWPMVFILITWQKIGPVFALRSFVNMIEGDMLCFFAVLGRLVGGFGGWNQTQIRPLLGYSSIGHTG